MHKIETSPSSWSLCVFCGFGGLARDEECDATQVVLKLTLCSQIHTF